MQKLGALTGSRKLSTSTHFVNPVSTGSSYFSAYSKCLSLKARQLYSLRTLYKRTELKYSWTDSTWKLLCWLLIWQRIRFSPSAISSTLVNSILLSNYTLAILRDLQPLRTSWTWLTSMCQSHTTPIKSQLALFPMSKELWSRWCNLTKGKPLKASNTCNANSPRTSIVKTCSSVSL